MGINDSRSPKTIQQLQMTELKYSNLARLGLHRNENELKEEGGFCTETEGFSFPPRKAQKSSTPQGTEDEQADQLRKHL